MYEDFVKTELEQVMAEHEGSTVLYLSGGSDSLLLLKILLDIGKHFNIVTFDYSFTKPQRQVIDDIAIANNLQIFSYNPQMAYMVGDGDKYVAFIEEYPMLDGATIPFVRDVVHDETRCIYDVKYDGVFQANAPIGFSLHLFGIRATDRHWAMGKAWGHQLVQYHGMTFYAPLWGWTRNMVADALKHYETEPPKIETGDLPMCTICMTAKDRVICPKTGEYIDPHDWHPVESLEMFKERHGRI